MSRPTNVRKQVFSFPAKSLLFRVDGRAGGRAAGEIENKANSGQIQLNLPVRPELGKKSRTCEVGGAQSPIFFGGST